MTEPEEQVILDEKFYTDADWRDVFIFLKVAEAGSFRHGIVEARTAMNTALDAAARLERLTRATLLTRRRHGIAPTPAGEELIRIARAIEQVFVRAAQHSPFLP